MNFEDLSDELKKKVSECKTPEDVLALAKQEGYNLSDKELEAISGGDGEQKEYTWSDVLNCKARLF